LAETVLPNAVVGRTFACIIMEQFKDLKNGDRYYYENGPSVTAFTLEQLAEIKKVKMSTLLCNNYDLTSIQPNSFYISSTA
jgi:peroxidase